MVVLSLWLKSKNRQRTCGYCKKNLFESHFSLVQLCEIDVTLFPPTILQRRFFAAHVPAAIIRHCYAIITLSAQKKWTALYLCEVAVLCRSGIPSHSCFECESQEENVCANFIADWFCPSQGRLRTYIITMKLVVMISIARFSRVWRVSYNFKSTISENSPVELLFKQIGCYQRATSLSRFCSL